jgi:hypothetical protein
MSGKHTGCGEIEGAAGLEFWVILVGVMMCV